MRSWIWFAQLVLFVLQLATIGIAVRRVEPGARYRTAVSLLGIMRNRQLV